MSSLALLSPRARLILLAVALAVLTVLALAFVMAHNPALVAHHLAVFNRRSPLADGLDVFNRR